MKCEDATFEKKRKMTKKIHVVTTLSVKTH